MQVARRILAVVAVLSLVSLAMPSAASAHEVRDVLGGKYRLVIGFLNEPVFVNDKSGLELRVTDVPAEGAEAVGVEGLEETLQAEVIYGDQKMALPIEPRFRDPGAYASYFYPTATEGDYTFHVWGTINGEQIDETFTSGPDTFGPVEERVEFPAAESASSSGAVIGSIGDGGSGSTGLLGGVGLGLVLGVAGMVALRRRPAPRRLVVTTSPAD